MSFSRRPLSQQLCEFHYQVFAGPQRRRHLRELSIVELGFCRAQNLTPVAKIQYFHSSTSASYIGLATRKARPHCEPSSDFSGCFCCFNDRGRVSAFPHAWPTRPGRVGRLRLAPSVLIMAHIKLPAAASCAPSKRAIFMLPSRSQGKEQRTTSGLPPPGRGRILAGTERERITRLCATFQATAGCARM